MSKVIIIGGGIIGLSSAYFLNKLGYRVTVIDRTDMLDGCSYGNAGYVCPSHFIPLATPGIVKQGLKWMLNSTSPFYVQPRFDMSLVNWGLKFMKSANAAHVRDSAVPLRDIALLSQKHYEQWAADPVFSFGYTHAGLLEMFRTEAGAGHAAHTVETAGKLGLDAVLLNRAETQALEPGAELDIAGAIFFKCDAHLDPGKLMRNLLAVLEGEGVTLVRNEAVTGFEKSGNKVNKVITAAGSFPCDSLVLAAGSWSRELASKLHLRIPMVGGRGYSLTLENSPFTLKHPAILTEGRVAVTPLSQNRIRFGGTMEITATGSAPRYNRVNGIIRAVKEFIPSFNIPPPQPEAIWSGFRPCSADGLPYIGRSTSYTNFVVATGHAMLGLSLGAGTGKLVSELIHEEKPSMDIRPFDPERFN